ncbi:MAG: site-specific DNA-methyltransferase [Deltaproteobacteria bacterium]|jgi:DNA modification methylase|nr:site-specific DNA-methyltransferase [Deltaproteobacteria bacterium]
MPRLTPREILEINRYLAEDKPLPDKYRFVLFADKREVELVWNGKSNEVCDVALPFQTVERVNGPREEGRGGSSHSEDATGQGGTERSGTERGETGASVPLGPGKGKAEGGGDGWSDKLIWGDNKLILSSLKSGPLRGEIERAGGVKLIYIDPPFDVGADFSMDIDIGEETFTKNRSVLEEIAYRDSWGKGTDSYLAMIYERLILMHGLLANNGSIYVHCDFRMSNNIHSILNEIFGTSCFKNEIVWCYRGMAVSGDRYLRRHDNIYFYSKSKRNIFNWEAITDELTDKTISKYKYTDKDGRKFRLHGRNINGSPIQNHTDIDIKWLDSNPDLCRVDYLDSKKGVKPKDWFVLDYINIMSNERVDYPTQKPEALLERVIKASSNEGDIVADFFCGSGTTPAVAAKLGRKWIAADIGKFAIHTTRKRLLGVQREQKKANKPYRPFEVLNLGHYERQHFVAGPQSGGDDGRRDREAKEKAFARLILGAYKAEKVEGLGVFHGKKGNRMVALGPVALPVTRPFVDQVISEASKLNVTGVDVLGFEFETGLFPVLLEEAKAQGLDFSPKYIPAEVFDKRAVENGQVAFHDLAHIAFKPLFQGNKVAVELTDYSIYFSQGSLDSLEVSLKCGSGKVTVHQGQIIKVTKDKNGRLSHETLTKKWTDWIDYWAVDFDYGSELEAAATTDPFTGGLGANPSGRFIFDNLWQTFRTKQNRSLSLKSAYHDYGQSPGGKKIAVKVVDILGNETMGVTDIGLRGAK